MSVGTTATTHKARGERWREQADFFDDAARKVDIATLPLDPLAFQRDTRPVLRKHFSKEFRFSILGNIAGRAVLDVGCGDGLNAVMFAKMGAKVIGIDISAKAIEVARRRAEVNGVSDSHQLPLCATGNGGLGRQLLRHYLGGQHFASRAG